MGDVVEKESACPSQQWPVDGRNGTAEKCPLLVSVISDCRVRMMKVGQHDNPMVWQLSPTESDIDNVGKYNNLQDMEQNKAWKNIPIQLAVSRGTGRITWLWGRCLKQWYHSSHEVWKEARKAGSAESEPWSILEFFCSNIYATHIRSWRILWGAHDIGQKVILPAKKLHKNHAKEGIDGRLLKNVMVVRQCSCEFEGETVIGARSRHIVFVALNGHRRLVVSMMSRPPRVVGYENELNRPSGSGQFI